MLSCFESFKGVRGKIGCNASQAGSREGSDVVGCAGGAGDGGGHPSCCSGTTQLFVTKNQLCNRLRQDEQLI